MIKIEVNEKGEATVELKGQMADICGELTFALIKVIKEDKRFASALRIALLLTGETEMSTKEKVALLETMFEFKDGEEE